ncbi:type II toxin-antitoxin system VapC family toxin [Frondihabitans cladoniiphilus]|uniref:Ribonuclease VapC n=1 Tax=Frondihabitans cladoniiphilus TaxID=715785 RepID=A0ABP8VYY0_9MICO
MIVLDTNVLSEPMRRDPEKRVVAWLDSQVDDLRVTAVSVGELLVGVRALPPGKRRDQLMASVERILLAYRDQVLDYDADAAHAYAEFQETSRSSGRALSVEDGMIAAICHTRKARLATRNTKDFEGLGIDVVNPWEG